MEVMKKDFKWQEVVEFRSSWAPEGAWEVEGGGSEMRTLFAEGWLTDPRQRQSILFHRSPEVDFPTAAAEVGDGVRLTEGFPVAKWSSWPGGQERPPSEIVAQVGHQKSTAPCCVHCASYSSTVISFRARGSQTRLWKYTGRKDSGLADLQTVVKAQPPYSVQAPSMAKS